MYHRKSGVFNLPFSSFTDPLLTHQPHWRFFFFDVQDRRSDDQFDPLIRSLRCLFCGYAGEDYRQNYRYQKTSEVKLSLSTIQQHERSRFLFLRHPPCIRDNWRYPGERQITGWENGLIYDISWWGESTFLY
jgi:hypothetical protein